MRDNDSLAQQRCHSHARQYEYLFRDRLVHATVLLVTHDVFSLICSRSWSVRVRSPIHGSIHHGPVASVRLTNIFINT